MRSRQPGNFSSREPCWSVRLAFAGNQRIVAEVAFAVPEAQKHPRCLCREVVGERFFKTQILERLNYRIRCPCPYPYLVNEYKVFFIHINKYIRVVDLSQS